MEKNSISLYVNNTASLKDVFNTSYLLQKIINPLVKEYKVKEEFSLVNGLKVVRHAGARKTKNGYAIRSFDNISKED